MAVKVAIFDFDGVLVESVDVKTKAFAQLFSAEGEEIVRKVVEYHLANGGISRFEKFRYYYRHFLNREYTESVEHDLGEQFSKLVFNAVIEAPPVPGALETLKRLHAQIPLYVASGTPEDELRHIVERRGLSGYFKGVYGTPKTKTEILSLILAEEGIEPSEAVMVGDAMTDYCAAQECHTRFVGRVRSGDRIFDGIDAIKLPDLSNFREVIGLG